MTTAAEVVDVYRRVLKSLDIVDTDGLLSKQDIQGQLTPVTIGGKRLVLPTSDILRQSKWKEWQAFHPLCEDSVAGESPVFKRLKIYIDIHLTATAIALTLALLGIAVDKDRHGTLDPRAIGLLQRLDNINGKAKDEFEKIRRVLEATGDKKLIHLRVQRGGKVGDTTYRRATLVTYPILGEFDRDDDVVFGVKLSSKKVKREIASLFRWILDIDTDPLNRHSKGSDAKQAPGLHSLLLAYASVQERFAYLFDVFKNELIAFKDLEPSLDWVDDITDMTHLYNKIPVLAGNDREEAADEPLTRGEPTRVDANSVVAVAPRPGPGGYSANIVRWSDRDDPRVREEMAENRKSAASTSSEEEAEFQRAKQQYETQQYSRRGGYGARSERDDRWGGRGRDDRDDRYGGRGGRDDRYNDRDRGGRADWGGRGRGGSRRI